MSTKANKPTPPKDERKLFFAASYRLANGKLRLQSFIKG